MPASQIDLARVVRELWVLPDDLEADEWLELSVYDGVTRDEVRGAWIIRAHYCRLEPDGNIVRDSYRRAETTISDQLLCLHEYRRDALVDLVFHALRSLIRTLRPTVPRALAGARFEFLDQNGETQTLPAPEPAPQPGLSLWKRLVDPTYWDDEAA